MENGKRKVGLLLETFEDRRQNKKKTIFKLSSALAQHYINKEQQTQIEHVIKGLQCTSKTSTLLYRS